MSRRDRNWTRLARWAAALLLPTWAAAAASLPADVAAMLERAKVPHEAVSIIVQEVGNGRTLLTLNPDQAMNPASLAKLVTTYAALDRLGPAFVWRTPVWLTGSVRDGVLDGSLAIRGSGDPTLVIERLWLLLRRVQQAGVHTIRGDIVLDRSAFAVPDVSAAEFDGEPLRPYNVRPDALLLNFKSVTYGFVPDPTSGRVRVTVSPSLAGADVDRSLPLASGPCGDWRAALKASFGDDGRVRFGGSLAAACGERTWPVADPQPQTYAARLVEGLWREMGGQLGGRVRDGAVPADRPPSFEVTSPALSEVVRDINKFSNNTMAQQLLLTLAAQSTPGLAASAERGRELLAAWLAERLGPLPPGVVLDNGAGLSREARLPASVLARLLQSAWAAAVMPELMASLPVSGLDGTLRRAQMPAGRAHLKTGSLRDVAGVAGYVLSDGGRRCVLVAIINHANAQAARPALDALVQWAQGDGAWR